MPLDGKALAPDPEHIDDEGEWELRQKDADAPLPEGAVKCVGTTEYYYALVGS
jgi:hypothetical protein